jgi:zinc protease
VIGWGLAKCLQRHYAATVLFSGSIINLTACAVPSPTSAPARVERIEAAPAVRDERLARRPPRDATTIQTTILPSGLLLLVDQDPYATRAGVVSVVLGGSSADPSGRDGLAHLVEHLTFRAVDRRRDERRERGRQRGGQSSRRERLIQLAAVETNGLTSPDTLTFYEFGPTEAVLDLIDLEAQRLVDPLAGVDDTASAIEQRVIASEFQLRNDPRAGLWAAAHLMPLVFPPPHPYARPPDVSVETRDSLTIESARAYANATFRPDRMTLLVTAPTGTVDLDSVIKRLPSSLVGDAARPVARYHLQSVDTAPPPHGYELKQVSSPLRAPQLWLAWVLPGSYGPQGPMETALTRWVQEDLDNDELRKSDPHIRQATATLIPGRAGSVLAVRVLLADGADTRRVAEIVTAVVSSLWTREAEERHRLERFKATIETQFALGEPPQIARVLEQAQQATLAAAPVRPEEFVQAIQRVSSAELSTLAQRLLTRERRQAVAFTPADVGTKTSAHSSQSIANHPANLFRDAVGWEHEPRRQGSPVGSLAMKRLASGLTLIVARRRAPSVIAWLGFHGGYADADPPLLVEVALRARLDAVEAPRDGALPGRAATLDASVETLEFSPADVARALPILFAKGSAPMQEWPAPEKLDRLLASVDTELDPSSKKADRDFGRALFGPHPLANTIDMNDLPKVTKASMDSWIGRVHDLRKAVLVVVGDVDADQVAAYAAALTTKLSPTTIQNQAAALSAPPLRPPGTAHVTSVLTPRRGTMTDVRLACFLPPMQAETRAAYEMLRLAMQQRLTESLRYERGETYDVNVRLEWLRGGVTYAELTTFVDASALTDVLGTLRAQWKRWGTAGFTDGEVAVARRLYEGTLSSAYAYGHAVAFHLFNDWNADPSAAGQDTFLGDPSAVSRARLGDLFATCRANAVLGVTGDENVISPAVDHSWPEVQ